MKKFIIALCLCALSVCAMAQQNNRQSRGPRRMADAVVDTAVINKMELAPEMVTKILELQQNKQEEMKAEMTQGRGQRGRMNEEERKAMAERRQAFSQKYRAELREIMGTENYILYLEKMLDARQMPGMGMGGRQNMGGAPNRQRPDFPQGGQMQMGGGFDGGDF